MEAKDSLQAGSEKKNGIQCVQFEVNQIGRLEEKTAAEEGDSDWCSEIEEDMDAILEAEKKAEEALKALQDLKHDFER